MGQHWANSVRRRRRLERITLVVIAIAIPVVIAIQILSTAAMAAGNNVRPIYYRVQKGDTLWRLSSKFGKSVSYLIKKNHISNANLIHVGDHLMVGTKPIVGSKNPSPSKETRKAPSSSDLPWSLRYHPERLKYSVYFDRWADRNSIPRDMVKALGFVESGWNNSAVSRVGAQGIGQLMPGTSVWIKSDLIGDPSLSVHNPEHNIRMSARYLRYLLKLSNGNENLAIGSYYQGFTSIRLNGMRSDTKRYIAAVNAYRKYFD